MADEELVGENDGGVGIMRMRGIIHKIRNMIPSMIEPDALNRTGDRGALAVWGRDISFVIQIGSTNAMTQNSDEARCYFQATAHGSKYGPELSWVDTTAGGVNAGVLQAIEGILPHILRERAQRQIDADAVAEAQKFEQKEVESSVGPSLDDELVLAIRNADPVLKSKLLAALQGG